jgi:hypothetical protein
MLYNLSPKCFGPSQGHYKGAAELQTQICKDSILRILTEWGCVFTHFSL